MNKFVKKIGYKDPVIGRGLYRLLNLVTGEEIDAFGRYLKSRARADDAPMNSINAWADDLVNFYNYYVAATTVIENLPVCSGSTPLSDIIFAYPQFLAKGKSALNVIAKEVAILVDASPAAKETAKRRVSTLRNFIRSSEVEYNIEKSLSEAGYINVDVAPDNIFKEINQRRELSESEKVQIKQRSWVAGVVSGGAKYINSPLFKLPKMITKSTEGKGSWVGKSFPVKSILNVIDRATSYRDRCFWSLLAGTGVRTSEGVQLLVSDVNAVTESVLILPYTDRIKEYEFVDDEGIEKLAFKGRNHEEVYFLEPFKTIFFDSLKHYLDEERPACDHDFLFVSLSNNARGRPFYLGDANSHNKTFKAVQRGMGFDVLYTLHSLRHFYGTWVHNFAKHDEGYGFDLGTVKIMMGHANTSTTERYAIRDRNLVRKKLASANKFMKENAFSLEGMKKASILNINEQVRQYLTSEAA